MLLEMQGNEKRSIMEYTVSMEEVRKKVKNCGCNNRNQMLMGRQGGNTAGNEKRKVVRRRWLQC